MFSGVAPHLRMCPVAVFKSETFNFKSLCNTIVPLCVLGSITSPKQQLIGRTILSKKLPLFWGRISYHRAAFPGVPLLFFTKDSRPHWHFQQVPWDHVQPRRPSIPVQQREPPLPQGDYCTPSSLVCSSVATWMFYTELQLVVLRYELLDVGQFVV